MTDTWAPRWAAGWAPLSMRVGPKGYIHNWIFVGAPGAGASVFHPHHGAGIVTEHNGAQATVRFHKSGAVHTFSAREGAGAPRLEPADVRETIAHARLRVGQVTERLDHHVDKSVDPGMRPILARMHDELGKSHPDVAKLQAELAEFNRLLNRPRRGSGPHRDAHLLAFYRDLADTIDGIDYLRKTPPSQRTATAVRFNPYHGKAGSGHGGQFTSSSGAGGGAAKTPAKAPAKAAQVTTKSLGSVARERRQLEAKIHADEAKIRGLEQQLHAERQALKTQASLAAHHQAQAAAAKKAAAHAHAQAAKAKTAAAHAKALASHKHHTAAHHHHITRHHTHHKHSLTHRQRITQLETQIGQLRAQVKTLRGQVAKL